MPARGRCVSRGYGGDVVSDEKHSPGPWRWDGPDSDVIYDADNVEVCRFVAGNADRFEPDGALIARAPDLLAEVERLETELAEANRLLGEEEKETAHLGMRLNEQRAARERAEAEVGSWRRVAERLTEERDEARAGWARGDGRASRLEAALSDMLAGIEPAHDGVHRVRYSDSFIARIRAALSPAPPATPVEVK